MSQNIEKINNFDIKFINLGKTKKGDFYVHMNGHNDIVNDVVCYKKVALNLIEELRNSYPDLKIPSYKDLEDGDKKSFKVDNYDIDIEFSSGVIKESRGKDIFYFSEYEIQNKNSLEKEITLIEDDFLPSLQFSSETQEERIVAIKEHIKNLENKLSFEENNEKENSVKENISEQYDSLDILNKEVDNEQIQEASIEQEEYGSDVTISEDNPEDYARAKFEMGNYAPQETLESVDKKDIEDDNEDLSNNVKEETTENVSIKPKKPSSIKPITLGKPKIGGTKKEKDINEQKNTVSNTQKEVKKDTTVEEEVSLGKVSETETNKPKEASEEKPKKPSIGGIKKPTIGSIKKPSIGGLKM
jgi:hypothetical protein